MASGSFNVTTSNQYISGRVSWNSSKSTSGNYSNVTATLYLSRTNTGYTTWGDGTFYIVINGVSKSNSKNFTITYNSNTVMVTNTVRVDHNDDGKKSITISARGSISGAGLSMSSQSGTAKLDDIARASTITTGSSWTAGNSRSVTISRNSSSFTHTVRWQIQDSGGTWRTVKTATGVGTSHSGDFSTSENKDIFTYLAQRASANSRISLETFSGSTKIGDTYYRPTGTCTAPAASSTSFNSFNIGETVGGSITRANSQFRHTIQLIFGSNTFTIHTKTTLTTWNYSTSSIASTLYGLTKNSNSLQGTLRFITYYSDGAQVRTPRDYTITAFVTDSNPTFGGNFTYRDINTTTTGITGNNQYIIQSKSSLRIEIPVAERALPVNSATMVEYHATVDGRTLKQPYSTTATVVFDFGEINASSNASVTVKAIDSRGNETPKSKTITVIPYTPPVVTVVADRVSGFEDDTVISVSGSLSSLNVNGANKNSIKIARRRHKSKDTSTYGSWVNLSISGFPNFKSTNATVVMDKLKQWDLQVEIEDQLSTTITNIVIPVGMPIFYIDVENKGVTVNTLPKIVDQTGTRGLEVGGGVYVRSGYFDINSFDEGIYGVGRLQTWYDANNKRFRMVGRDPSYRQHSITLDLEGQIKQGDWIEPSLQNGWEHYSEPTGGFTRGQYRYTTHGTVQFRGFLKRVPHPTADIIIFQLPTGWNPEKTEIFVAKEASANGVARIQIDRLGRVFYILSGSGGNTTYVSIANIEFFPASPINL